MFLIKKGRLADAQYLLLTLWLEVQKQPFTDVLENSYFQKFSNIYKKAPVLESLFSKIVLPKA